MKESAWVPQVNGAPLIVPPLVKAHIVAAMASFIIAILSGFYFSLLFLQHYPFEGIPFLSPGRVRMVHTNLIAYGFLFNAFVGGLYWAIPRTTGRPVFNAKLGWLIFWVWQVVVLSTFLGILGGQAQGIEWGKLQSGSTRSSLLARFSSWSSSSPL